MPRDLNILYVAALAQGFGGTDAQRMRSLEENGHRVVPFGMSSVTDRSLLGGLGVRLRRRGLSRFLGDERLTPKLWAAVREGHFDVVWIDKGVELPPRALKGIRQRCPAARIVGYSPDDMMNPANGSPNFLRTLPLYDLYFTTKTYGVEELRNEGCPRVLFVPNAYDSHLHRPVAVTADERQRWGGPVGFIGTAEEERAHTIRWLAEQGVPIKVWGNGWERAQRELGGKFEVAGPSQYGETYVKIMCAFDINLAFLRKVNRDRQTQRSIEIPACGAFMLAERTDEHRALFEEGTEAEFFATDAEALEKIRYYLAHPDERQRIARAGRQRCLDAGYSNRDRVAWMLEQVGALPDPGRTA